jgi:hypothetical protein
VDDAPPGRGTIPDPRRFVYVEACGEVGTAALAFELAVRDTWVTSDRGVTAYRITRDGCFRVALPLPSSSGPSDLRTLRVRAFARHDTSSGHGAGTPTSIRLDRITRVFMLDDEHKPGPSLLRWTGPASIQEGTPLDLSITEP